jgi:hypothetical protein
MSKKIKKYIDVINNDKASLTDKISASKKCHDLIEECNEEIKNLKNITDKKDKYQVTEKNFDQTIQEIEETLNLFEEDCISAEKIKKLKEVKLKLMNASNFIHHKNTVKIFTVKNDIVTEKQLNKGILIDVEKEEE